MKKQKIPKDPSFLKQAFTIAYERAQTRRALRLLTKQEWSVDFLTALLIRASRLEGKPLEMSLTNKASELVLKVSTLDTPTSTYRDDSIFNHLDNEIKVRQFINEVNSRR